eukprot:12000356-Alexandrium_andersonii.AAC.1
MPGLRAARELLPRTNTVLRRRPREGRLARDGRPTTTARPQRSPQAPPKMAAASRRRRWPSAPSALPPVSMWGNNNRS